MTVGSGRSGSGEPSGCQPSASASLRESSRSGIPNAALNRAALCKLVEAALADAAGDQFDYACFHLYRAQGKDAFYGANLHAGQWCRIGHGGSLAEALEAALTKEPRYIPREDAA